MQFKFLAVLLLSSTLAAAMPVQRDTCDAGCQQSAVAQYIKALVSHSAGDANA